MTTAKRNILLLNLVLWAATFATFTGQGFVTGYMSVHLVVYTILSLMFGFCGCLALHGVIDHLRGPERWRWLAIGLAGIAMMLIHSVLDVVLQQLLWPLIKPSIKAPPLTFGVVTNILSLTQVYMLFIVGAALIYSNDTLRQKDQILAQSQAAAQEAQLAALRFQINPHFLFNALNAVTSLISSGRNADAERASTTLADFMRASLEIDPSTLVTLGQEIDAVATYMDIEQIRFGDRLSVFFDVPEDLLSLTIPPLLLQPLFENAVRHGLGRSIDPVTIRLKAERLGAGEASITVVNEAQGLARLDARPTPGTGTGLANIRSRLAGLYGDAGRLETQVMANGFSASIFLPVA